LPKRAPKKAVFLDRDGTVIVDTVFSVDPARLEPLPGSMEGLRRLQDAGYLLIIITNQSGVARGKFDEAGLQAFHDHMLRWFEERGIRLTAIYHCPHYPDGDVPGYAVECECRKPAPGLLLRAANDHGIDLHHSWMIGDRPADIGAGLNAGCRTIKVGALPFSPEDPAPQFTAADLREAADLILHKRQ
jgi:D,D-heptose 1,7-bisphosphate phosphatase